MTPQYEPYVAPDYTMPAVQAADSRRRPRPRPCADAGRRRTRAGAQRVHRAAAVVARASHDGARRARLAAQPAVPTVPAQPIQPAPTFARPEYPPPAPPRRCGASSRRTAGSSPRRPATPSTSQCRPCHRWTTARRPRSVNGDDGDPFANLPRLSRFDDSIVSAPMLPPLTYPASAPALADVEPARPAPAPPAPVNGEASRHAAPEGPQPSDQPAEAGGGRRRRVEGDANDVLARLLDNR